MFPTYKAYGDNSPHKPEAIYPYNKSLITFKINQNLLDEKGFGNKLDTVLKMDECKTNGKHKIEDRVDTFEADFRSKVGMIDSVFNNLMNEAKEEFLVKPSPYHTREEIRKYIDMGAKREKGRKIFIHKNTSDFDVIHVHRYSHFTDHTGNYLTKTGHKIDDFSLSK